MNSIPREDLVLTSIMNDLHYTWRISIAINVFFRLVGKCVCKLKVVFGFCIMVVCYICYSIVYFEYE